MPVPTHHGLVLMLIVILRVTVATRAESVHHAAQHLLLDHRRAAGRRHEPSVRTSDL